MIFLNLPLALNFELKCVHSSHLAVSAIVWIFWRYHNRQYAKHVWSNCNRKSSWYGDIRHVRKKVTDNKKLRLILFFLFQNNNKKNTIYGVAMCLNVHLENPRGKAQIWICTFVNNSSKFGGNFRIKICGYK